ncbi:hypothetical protein D3C73_1614470 [compost metagenome]
MIIFIQQLGACDIFDVVTQVEIDVVVVAAFLNQIPIFETHSFRHIYRCGGVGLAHVSSFCSDFHY